MRTTKSYSGKAGLYCSVNPVKGFSQLLQLIEDKLDSEEISLCDRNEMHCTIMYSPDDAPHSIRVLQLLDAPPHTYRGWSDKIDYWEGHDKCGYLVLRINSRDLALRHEQYKDLGCRSTFPNYEAHITLAKDLSKPKCLAELNKLLKNLKFEITFGGEKVEDIKD